MKRLVIACVLCSMVALSLLVAGCGVDKSKYLGDWKLAYSSAENMNADTLKMVGQVGYVATLHLNEDGTGKLNLFGDEKDAQWSAKSSSEGTISFTDTGSAQIKLANSELSIVNSDGVTMTFEKAGS